MHIFRHAYIIVFQGELVLGVNKESIRESNMSYVMSKRSNYTGQNIHRLQSILHCAIVHKISKRMKHINSMGLIVERISLILNLELF